MTSALAYGPTSAQATATGAANVTWVKWRFTATPATGAAVALESDAPLVWWYNLVADTPCEWRLRGWGRGEVGVGEGLD